MRVPPMPARSNAFLSRKAGIVAVRYDAAWACTKVYSSARVTRDAVADKPGRTRPTSAMTGTPPSGAAHLARRLHARSFSYASALQLRFCFQPDRVEANK